MNAYMKYALIPYNQYQALRKDSPFAPIIESNLPTILKNAQITKRFKVKKPSISERPLIDFESAGDAPDNTLKSDVPSNYLTSQDVSSFNPQTFSTPQRENTFHSIVNSKDEVLNSLKKPIKRSNIKRVKKYLKSETVARAPPGANRLIKRLAVKPRKTTIINPTAKEKLRKFIKQGGSGIKLWSSVKKF